MDKHTSTKPAVAPKAKTFVHSFASDFLAGGLASILSKTAMAPIERCDVVVFVTIHIIGVLLIRTTTADCMIWIDVLTGTTVVVQYRQYS